MLIVYGIVVTIFVYGCLTPAERGHTWESQKIVFFNFYLRRTVLFMGVQKGYSSFKINLEYHKSPNCTVKMQHCAVRDFLSKF